MAKANPTMLGNRKKPESKFGADEFKFIRCDKCKAKFCIQTNPEGCPACLEKTVKK